MTQVGPNYPHATGKPEKPIVDALIAKYGLQGISWPIVLSKDNQTIAYLYERNSTNQINSPGDFRPTSKVTIPAFEIDYAGNPRTISPTSAILTPFIAPMFRNSYEFIIKQDQGFSTVDLDYVWRRGSSFRGMELTTFWVNFSSETEAKRVVSMMNRRPSWQGVNGAQALHKIADAADDLAIEYFMVCANTVSKVGSALNTAGNVLYFQLSHDQIDRLSKGLPPAGAVFCSFEQFLAQL